MRSALLCLLLAAPCAMPLEAAVTFVSPQNGTQAIGVMALEVSTDVAAVDRVDFSVDGALAGVARKPPYRIAYDFGASVEPRRVTAKVWSNGFKTSETATVLTTAIGASDAMTVDVVEVPLRVRASREVKPADLRVRENGVEQTVREVVTQRPPAHFAFIVDRSLSMGDGKLTAALRAIDEVRGQLREGDTASLIFFNHNVSAARPIPRSSPIDRAFMSIKPSGGTSLRDAVASINTEGRTYAIVITDGGDRNSALGEEEALRRISGTRTFVHALVLGASHARFLDRVAANTGGSVVETTSIRLAGALRSLLGDINSRHLLVYQSTASKNGWRSVEVAGRNGVTVVSARKGYYAR